MRLKNWNWYYLATIVLLAGTSTGRGDDWPQWLGPQRDSVWRETGLVEKFPEGEPVFKWRVPINGGYAGPAVADDRVYVTDYEAPGDRSGDPARRDKLKGKERVLCYDVANGKPLWKHEYDCAYSISYPAGPRCTPTIHEGKVYTLGAMGDLYCLSADTGKVLWSRDFKKDYGAPAPVWGFCGHPLVVGQRLICLVGGEGSVAVAFDKDTGKELWKALSAREIGYAPPTLIEVDGKPQVVIWHAESINGLDPETGKVFWSVPLEPSFGMSIAQPRLLGHQLYASGMGSKGALLKLAAEGDKTPTAEVVWRGKNTNSLYSSNSTPFLEGEMMYGIDCTAGALRGVKLETGERVWESSKPVPGKPRRSHGTAFLVKQADRFFLMSETGDLIIAKLTPEGYDEISRMHLLEPTSQAFGRDVVWSHPAFAHKCIFARNDKELVCLPLAKKP